MENVVGLLHGGLRLTFKLPAGFFQQACVIETTR